MSGKGLPPDGFARGLAACLLGCGLLIAAAGLLALNLGERRAFGMLAGDLRVTEARFRVTAEAARPGPGGWMAVLFWDPACPCAARSARVAGELMDALPDASRLAVVVPRASLRGRAERRFASFEPVVFEASALPMPPSAPALALVDDGRSLRYLGPHVMAPACGQRDAAPTGAVRLMTALAGPSAATLTPTAVRGCFCPWLAESPVPPLRPAGTRRGLHPLSNS